jgi:hypothetical protein
MENLINDLALIGSQPGCLRSPRVDCLQSKVLGFTMILGGMPNIMFTGVLRALMEDLLEVHWTDEEPCCTDERQLNSSSSEGITIYKQ